MIFTNRFKRTSGALFVSALLLWGVVGAIPAHALDASFFLNLLIERGLLPAGNQEAARSLLAEEEQKEAGGVVAEVKTPATPIAVCPYMWTRDLMEGARGEDVKKLQEFLNANVDTRVNASGPGSPGQETSYFGPLTAQAVSVLQEKYSGETLAPINLTSGTGYFGSLTRQKANTLCGDPKPVETVVSEEPEDAPTTESTAVTQENMDDVTPADRVGAPPGITIRRVDTLGEFVSVPRDSKEVNFGTFELKTGDGGATIVGVGVQRFGVEEATDIAHVWLMVDGRQHENPKTFSKDIAFFSLGRDLIEIPPNWMAKLSIYGALSSDAKIGNFNTLGLSIIDANVPIQTELPAKGPLITISSKTTE